MINIFYNGNVILATDEGEVVNPLSYWDEEILGGIHTAFENGHYESVIESLAEPEPQWTPFNIVMLSNSYWQSWVVPADVRTAMISAFVNGKQDAAQSAYDVAKRLVPPSAEAIVEWQALVTQYYIPMVL